MVLFYLLFLMSITSPIFAGLHHPLENLAQSLHELSLFIPHKKVGTSHISFENFPTFKEWKSKISTLPYNRKGANYCKNTGLTWLQCEEAITLFFNSMQNYYQQKQLWLADAPLTTDDFLNTQKYNLFKPFVQKLIVHPGDIIALRGDLHGDVKSLIAYIEYLQKNGYLDITDAFKITDTHKKNFYMIFLGDYVDRGAYGIEVLYTLIRLKIANPDNVFFVRGNHEDIGVSSSFGFSDEIKAKFPDQKNAYKRVCRLYDFLPVALYLGCNNNFIQCCHGGMEIGYLPHNLLNSNQTICYEWLKKLLRKTNADTQKISFLYYIPKDTEATPAPVFSFFDIGFMWNDFSVNTIDDNQPVIFKKGRGLEYGKWATEKILALSSSSNILKTATHHEKQVLGVFRAHQHSPGPFEEMWQSLMKGNGLSKLWQNTTQKDIGTNLWPGIVCTFLVAPDSVYGDRGDYAYDAFGILTTEADFNNWKLELHRNEFNF